MFQFQCVDVPFETRSEILNTALETVNGLVPEHHGIITLAVIDDERMRELNLAYRNIDATTDVLSFHYFDDFSKCKADEVVGEIVFSESRLQSQANDFHHGIETEFYRLAVHGLVHILGFDHESDEEYEDMWNVESQILRRLSEKFDLLHIDIES